MSGLRPLVDVLLGGQGVQLGRRPAEPTGQHAPGAPEVAARVARALGTDDAVAGLRALADAQGIPRGLRELGMPEAAVAEAAARTARAVPADNPVPVTEAALRRLVQAAWSGEPVDGPAARRSNGT